MSTQIRGLSIEIGANTTEFNKQMREVRQDAKYSQQEFNNLAKALELEYDETTFVKAQEKAQDVLDATSKQTEALTKRLEHLETIGKVDTAEYKRLQAELSKTELNALQTTKQLEKLNEVQLRNVSNNTEELSKRSMELAKNLAAVSAVATGFLVGLGAMGNRALTTANELSRLSATSGITAEGIQRLNYVAMQLNVSSNALERSLNVVRRGIVDMSRDVDTRASAAIRSLGLELEGLTPDDQFMAVITGLSNITDEAERVRLANDILGYNYANQLLPIINAGADAINELGREFDTLGGLTNSQVERMAELQSVLNRVRTAFNNVTLQIGSALMPVFEAMANFLENYILPAFQSLADWMNSLDERTLKVVVGLTAFVALLAPMALAVGVASKAVGKLQIAFLKLDSVLSKLATNPIILLFIAIAAILTYLFLTNEEFRESIMNLVSTLTSALMPILDILISILDPIVEIIKLLADTLAVILIPIFQMLEKVLEPIIFIIQIFVSLLEVQLLPLIVALNVALSLLEVPLSLIGKLVEMLSGLFEIFGDKVEVVMNKVMDIVEVVISKIEAAINFVIDMVNFLIRQINRVLGFFGQSINELDHISLALNRGDTNIDSGDVYDGMRDDVTNSTTNNYDFSRNQNTQNVTVTIQNYAEEVDVDDLVNQINVRLSRLM